MERENFEIREEHLKLIKRLRFESDRTFMGYDDSKGEKFKYNAITIDIKRPYGTKTVFQDMLIALDKAADFDDATELIKTLSDEETDYYVNLHKEVATALEICTSRLEFKTGVFKEHFNYWEKLTI